MDLGEITKVANRKRLNADAESETVSRGTAKIVVKKLKVSQDTAYWDLNEKLQQVEGNHEQLQQNMVEAQMQHDAISGQYQDELRLRPDTLNKLSTTREICDMVEEYSERLKETLSRWKGDQASLCEAYRKSGQLVLYMKNKNDWADEKNRLVIDSLQETVNILNEHHNKLVSHLSAAKQQAEVELSEARGQLTAVRAHASQLTAAGNELACQLELDNKGLRAKEKMLEQIQKEAEQIMANLISYINHMKNETAEKNKQIKACTEEIEALKRDLSNQKEYTANVREQNEQLMEKLAAGEVLLQAAAGERQQLLQDLQIQNNADAEIINLKETLSNLECEKLSISSQLAESQAQLEGATAKIAKLQDQHQVLMKTHEDIVTGFKTYREEQKAKINELSETIVEKDKELDSKAETIAAAADRTARVEAALDKLRAETDAERNAAAVRDQQHAQQLERLQAVIAIQNNADAEIINLKETLSNLECEKLSISSQLAESQAQLEGATAKIAKLQDQHQVLMKTHEDIVTGFKTYREEQKAKINELSETIVEKDKELDSKAETIAAAADRTARVEAALDKLRAETDAERNAAAVRDQQHAQQLERLQAVIAIQNNADAEIINLKETLSNLECEKLSISSQLAESQAQLEGATAKIAKLQDQHQVLMKTHEDIVAGFKTYREKQKAKINELSKTIVEKDKELDSKAETIAAAADRTARVEAALDKLRAETDAERNAAAVRDQQHAQQLERLQAVIADKESELTKHMSVILDMRNEKERLQEKIEGMQNKIDNIQKELSAPQLRQLAQLGDPPKQDDNAAPFALTSLPQPVKGLSSVSQMKNDMKNKEESFIPRPVFSRTNRADNKIKTDNKMKTDNEIKSTKKN